eukprot:TRINITY_DN2688_c1_g1_i2.p1 TRINITY_DN2688_c1_g1~~TRINITY_DN2688_c1_g1_i2.p1  ORF type:complete len:394 (+),score=53.61 TRINITY_DN2688_c1_g1_i2:891-2072(+)
MKSSSDLSLRVPMNMVTVDGTECNKIGVSYEAFFTQGGRCDAPDGTCLKGQIIDLLIEDMLRGPGKVPLYSMPTLASYLRDSHLLPVPTEGIASLIVTVEIDNVEDLYFAINHSTSANITSVEMLNADGMQFTESGYLAAKVLNSGKVPSTLTVVAEAPNGGLSIMDPSVSKHFEVNQEHTISWIIHARDNSSKQSTRSVVITVQSVKFEELDRRSINITSNAVIVDEGAQGGEQKNHSGSIRDPDHESNNNNNDPDSPESCTDCPWYNPICFIIRECFLRGVLQFVGTVLLIITIGYLVVKGHALRFLKWCLNLCYSKNRNPKTNKKNSDKVHITVSDFDSSSDEERRPGEQPQKAVSHNPVDAFYVNCAAHPVPGHAHVPAAAARSSRYTH